MNKLEKNQNVKGFSYLFLYYWFEIFNNKTNSEQNSEPGPKKSLAVLSRIPMSQLFESLTLAEQDLFTTTFSPLIFSRGHEFRIGEYRDYKGGIIQSTLTLREWHESIVDESKRLLVNERLVDKLSPPPGLENTGYSMGYYDREKHASGYPLLEVRGYASLEYKISDLSEFVTTEARWFEQLQ
jgi:hypothetical protein